MGRRKGGAYFVGKLRRHLTPLGQGDIEVVRTGERGKAVLKLRPEVGVVEVKVHGDRCPRALRIEAQREGSGCGGRRTSGSARAGRSTGKEMDEGRGAMVRQVWVSGDVVGRRKRPVGLQARRLPPEEVVTQRRETEDRMEPRMRGAVEAAVERPVTTDHAR